MAALAASAPARAQERPAPDAYRDAVAARLAGDPAKAVDLLTPVVAADPRNADAQVQLGYALLALDRLDAAELAFRAALQVAPDYADARLGLARLSQRRGDRKGALRELAPLDPTNLDVRSLRTQLDPSQGLARWSVDIDGSYSELEGRQPDWREGTVQIGHQVSERTAARARIEASRRFGRTDIYGEVGVDQAVGTRGRLFLALGGTPNAEFRPRWQTELAGSYRLTDGGAATVLTVNARHAEFVAGNVQAVSPGIEQYLANGRASVTARWINLFDENGRHQSGWLLRGDVEPAERLRLFAGLSDAPDTSEGVVVDTRSYFGGISLAVSERITGRFSLAFEDRESGADRLQLGTGIGLRF